MTRHFLRDKNGEEEEIPKCYGSDFDYYYLYTAPDCTIWSYIRVKKKEISINQKLEFVVWEEV